jgi:hypothetical protein
MRTFAPIAVAAMMLAGCGGGPTLDRWSKASGVPGFRPPVLYVGSAPAAAAASDPLTIKALPDRLGAAYVVALAAREKSSKDLRAAMAAAFNTPGDGGGGGDLTKIGRVLLLSVQRAAFRPGDRLLATTISIRPAGFRFTDYTLATTDRATVNIGAVSITDQRGANLSAAPGPASAIGAGVTAGLTASRSATGTRNIINTTELSVHVAPDGIEAYRSGTEGQDLTGNTLIKLALQLPADQTVEYTVAAPHVTDDDGRPLPAAKASLGTRRIGVNPAADLYVCARLSYQDRTIVDDSRAHYDEGRQSVALRSDALPWSPYLIVPAQDIETPLWLIMGRASPLLFDDGLTTEMLTFDDYDNARMFLAWLGRARTATLADGVLMTGAPGAARALTRFEGLSVRRIAQTRGVSAAPTCGADGRAVFPAS